MGELRVTLETVTPVLAHGTDSHLPELRAPSFRGLMRYWWRATLGAIVGDSKRRLETLKKLESLVFGSTDCGSPVSIRLIPINIQETSVFLLPHKKQVRRKALLGKFELLMIQTQRIKPLIWNAACSSLELALTCGGIGQRSRRGYGALRISQTSLSQMRVFPTTVNGWKAQVTRATQKALSAAVQLMDSEGVSLKYPTVPSSYPCANRKGTIRLCDLKQTSAIQSVEFFMRHTPQKNALGSVEPRRQASPLWMHPIQTGDSEYGALCVVLASRFKDADYSFVRKFLDGFQGEYLPVKGWNA